MYKLEQLQDPSSIVNSLRVNINGHYVTAKPLSVSGWYGLYFRVIDAWKVLTNKADAFVWPEGQ